MADYSPPGISTTTTMEQTVATPLDGLRVPLLIGEGAETLLQSDLEVTRGSSATKDHRVVGEDVTGRSVVAQSSTGTVSTLGAFDGERTKIQVRNWPIVDGTGTGTPTTSRMDVTVTLNGNDTVVREVQGALGVIQLVSAPQPGDVVRVTYTFDRRDTQVTDDVSAQVPDRAATIVALSGIADVNATDAQGVTLDLHGAVTDALGNVTSAANNVLNLTVDGVDRSLVLPPRAYTMAQVAQAITAQRIGTLTAGTLINNLGHSTLVLQAEHSLVVNNGSANTLLGLHSQLADKRVSTFYVFAGPIVDGTGGGLTSNDPAHVVVRVNGRVVPATSVEGTSRAITLALAPAAKAKVTITYNWNSWQDTFDYLNHADVLDIKSCSSYVGLNDYTEGADFVLRDGRVYWGSAVTVKSDVTEAQSTALETQVTATLVDAREFLETCILDTSRRSFLLPDVPTLGNGRDTPLAQDLFQTLSNGRNDLPTNRPDLIQVYWGFSVQDALARGPVPVTAIDGLTVTLASAVPVGAGVWATYYHSALGDAEYTIKALSSGGPGEGQFQILDASDAPVVVPSLVPGSKGAGLTGIDLEFPSGSSLTPDLRYVSQNGSQFKGPVEELVTVQMASQMATPARHTLNGYGPFAFIGGQSDRLRIQVRGQDTLGASGLNLASPSKVGSHVGGFFASLVGDEISYAGGAGATVGQNVTLDADLALSLVVDGVTIPVVIPAKTAADATYFATCINEQASGHHGVAQAGSIGTTLVLAATASSVNDYYKGWTVVLGNSAEVGAAAGGQARTITAYNGTTKTATVAAWAADPPVATQAYNVYQSSTLAQVKSVTRFNGPVTLAAGKHTKLTVSYTGSTAGAKTFTATLNPGTYATADALATALQERLAIARDSVPSAPHAGLSILVSADASGRLVFKVQNAGVDASGYLQFVAAAAPAEDFAILAGLDTGATAEAGQATLVQGHIARTYKTPGAGQAPYDRIVLRGRLLPGGAGSLSGRAILDQCGLKVLLGNTVIGLPSGAIGEAGSGAVVHPATLRATVSVLTGLDADGKPQVTFYDGTGANAANNLLQLNIDGTPVSVTFTASAMGTVTPLGPVSNAASIAGQIKAALTFDGAPWDASTLVTLEGAGIRISGYRVDSSARITIGTGSANASLGLGAGEVYGRTLVSTEMLASALMSNQIATFPEWMFDLADANASFTAVALAGVVDGSLYVQDAPSTADGLGAASTVIVRRCTAFAQGTGFVNADGTGSHGSTARDGFFVLSNNPNGSGSINTSRFNNGVGADGIVGQTYRDEVTGLSFTLMPRGWSSDHVGPWGHYPTGAQVTFRIQCATDVTTSDNPVLGIPGIELRVTDLMGVAVGNTAKIGTFRRSGLEPGLGESYFVTYTYRKSNWRIQYHTSMATVEAEYGSSTHTNPLSLAANLAFMNGARLVACLQVPRDANSSQASLNEYAKAIATSEITDPGRVSPSIVVLLRGDSLELFQKLKTSCNKMSSRRYRAERTAILGVASGTSPKDIITMARGLRDARMRLMYPDIAQIKVTSATGASREYLVDGVYLAAALAGAVVSPSRDVATPWTGLQLFGFARLARTLNEVEADQIASEGVTLLTDNGQIKVRDGLTTDMSTVLTQTPSVVQIADDVQQSVRAVCERFVGVKYLAGIKGQIEGVIATHFRALVERGIIAGYGGLKVVDTDDPRAVAVKITYAPILPLLYIEISFTLRTKV